jgi:hypothetical protein
MRRLTFRRSALLIVTGLWLVTVIGYWRVLVPVLPLRTMRFDEPVHVCGVSRAGELMICRQRIHELAARGEFGYSGPIEYWDPKSGRKTREWLGRDDLLEGERVRESGELVLHRGGKRFLIVPERQEIVQELPAESPIVKLRMLPDRRQIAYSEKDVVHLFDLSAKTEMWKAPGQYLVEVGRDFVVVRPDPVAAGRRTRLWASVLSLQSGEHDPRFDHVSANLIQIDSSPDGRYAVVSALGKISICDATSGRVLWSLPVREDMHNFRFENNGDEVCTDLLDASGTVQVVRWRSADGVAMTPIPSTSGGFAFRFPSSDQRHFVDYLIKEQWPPFATLGRVFRWLGIAAELPGDESVLQISAANGGRRLGFVRGENRTPVMMPSGSGFAVESKNVVEYYELPPRRDWLWLVTWIAPVLIVWVGAASCWLWKRRSLRTSAN